MKKVLKKSLAIVTAATLTASVGITSFASTFSDVTDTTYPWAIEAIESMAKEGIIKGYEDGSFAPAKTVSKLESLVLVSRILGMNDEANKDLVTAAWDVYCDTIEDYDLSFGSQEIAYLLMKGVINKSELDDYISKANRDDGLKRYEVAILLTKALDAENSIDSEIISKLTYTDNSDIPANAKKYVAYVSENNLMQGMDGNKFAPNETVTRAQAAVVLFKLQYKTKYTFKSGNVTYFDQTTRNIKINTTDGESLSHYITSSTILRHNGELINVNDIQKNYNALVTYKDKVLYAIDFSDALVDDVVYGSFVGASSTTKGDTINIYKLGETDTDIQTTNKTSYKMSKNCVITYNGNTCSLQSLKQGYYVKLTIKQNEVTVIEAQSKTSTVTGRVDSVSIDPVLTISIEENGGGISAYLLSSSVTVKKNGKTASARDIVAGDSITATLNYGRISSITATSKSTTKTGTIKEVIISKNPRITLVSGNEELTFAVTNDAEIKVGGKEGTFYDLRVGASASVKMDSDTVVSIETVNNDTVMTIDGTVTLVNASYGLIQVEYVDSLTGETKTESIFVKDNASIVGYETQKTIKLSALTVGSRVTVTGTTKSGVFEAGAVVVISAASANGK